MIFLFLFYTDFIRFSAGGEFSFPICVIFKSFLYSFTLEFGGFEAHKEHQDQTWSPRSCLAPPRRPTRPTAPPAPPEALGRTRTDEDAEFSRFKELAEAFH